MNWIIRGNNSFRIESLYRLRNNYTLQLDRIQFSSPANNQSWIVIDWARNWLSPTHCKLNMQCKMVQWSVYSLTSRRRACNTNFTLSDEQYEVTGIAYCVYDLRLVARWLVMNALHSLSRRRVRGNLVVGLSWLVSNKTTNILTLTQFEATHQLTNVLQCTVIYCVLHEICWNISTTKRTLLKNIPRSTPD